MDCIKTRSILVSICYFDNLYRENQVTDRLIKHLVFHFIISQCKLMNNTYSSFLITYYCFEFLVETQWPETHLYILQILLPSRMSHIIIISFIKLSKIHIITVTMYSDSVRFTLQSFEFWKRIASLCFESFAQFWDYF